MDFLGNILLGQDLVNKDYVDKAIPVVPTKLSQFTDDVVSGKYLPLSGGTITSNANTILTLKGGASNSYSVAYFMNGDTYRGHVGWSSAYGFGLYHSTQNAYLGIKDDGTPHYNNYTLIHSGNIGSQSVSHATTTNRFKVLLEATSGDLNTALAAGGVARNYDAGLSQYTNAPEGASFGMVLELRGSIASSLAGQLAWDVNHGSTSDVTRNLWWRASDSPNGFTYGKWHQIAFTDSNVASASKLKDNTAFTAWGQTFFENGKPKNVSGNLYLGTGTIRSSKSGTDRVFIDFSSAGDPYIGYGIASAGIDSHLCGNNIYLHYGTSRTNGLILNSSGNVTIGGSDLAGTTYKMSVDGKVHIRSTMGASMSEGAGSLIVGNGAVLMIDTNDIQAKTNGTTAGPLYLNAWGGNVILCGHNNGNVLIGPATDSGYKLDVAGTGRFTGAVTMSSTLSVTTSVTSNRFLTSGDCGLWKGSTFSGVYTNNDIALSASTIGIVGNVRPHSNNAFTLGTSSYQWSNIYGVNGIFSGDTSSGSDIRFKDIIKNKTIKIADIAKAPLFTFKWNDRDDDAIHLGSSAQYWEKVCPWLVTGEDFKSLNYATLGVAMGISLAKKTVNHEERIEELERKVKSLEEENRRLRYGN